MAGGHKYEHDYHIIEPSPWPLLASIGTLVLALGAIAWMRSLNGETFLGMEGPTVFFVGLGLVAAIAFLWWRDVIKEAQAGHHTPVVQLHLRYGMILFIASEIMFFVAWFWAYFDVALFPDATWKMLIWTDNVAAPSDVAIGNTAREELLGGQWPPVKGEGFEKTFNPWGLPLVNTLILLLSGTTVTWAHHALLENDRKGLIWGLALTVALGCIFTLLQAYEYGHAAFSYSGHIYGATFFMATGFHGAHVVIGTVFLAVCLVRALQGAYTPQQHFGFEAAAWYWHFVDVVWLFLFMAIYIWGA